MKKRIFPLFWALRRLPRGFLRGPGRGGIKYYDYAAGLWHETGASMDGLSAVDRALLARGLPLEDAAALTRALEDFCT